MVELFIALVVAAAVVFLLLHQRERATKIKGVQASPSAPERIKLQPIIDSPQPVRSQPKPVLPPEQWLTDASSRRRLLCRTVAPEDLSLFQKNNSQAIEHTHLIALKPFLESIPNLLDSVRGGTVVQILGPPELLAGLKSGAYHTLQSGGHLGAVADSHSIVGNLRFGNPMNVASVTVPAAIFQVASAVTLQYYLHQMNDRLDALQKGIESLIQRQQNARYGKISAAKITCDDVRGVLRQGCLPHDPDVVKINDAITRINEACEESEKNIRDFYGTVSEVMDGKNMKRMSKLFHDASTDRLYDAQLLLFSISVRISLYDLKHEMELYLYPDRLAINIQNVENQIDDMKKVYEQVRNLYGLLDGFEGIVEEKSRWQKAANWSTLTTLGYNKNKQHFQEVTQPLREAVQQPFPKQDVNPPFIIECRMGISGDLEARYAMIAPEQSLPKQSARKRRGKFEA